MDSNYRYYLFQMRRSLGRFVFTPYFGIRKFANAAALGAQFLLFKNSRVVGYPLKISIDPTNECMLRCPLCPTGRGENGRPGGKMEPGNFRKVIDEMHPYLYEVCLNNWGEPFLNRGIYGMVEYAHGRGIMTSINSNLNVPLSEKDAERLVLSGLDQLYVSFDGIKQETYQKYRVNGKLKNVFRNIRLVAGKKKELGRKNPRIDWQFLVMRHNEHEVPELERVRKELGIDNLIIGCVRSDLGKEIFKSDGEKINETSGWLPENEVYSRYDYKNRKREVRKKYCHFLWFVTVVNWDGSVSPCCAVYERKHDFGNAFTEGIRGIWNNDLYRASRDLVAGRKASMGTVCANCLRTGFVD